MRQGIRALKGLVTARAVLSDTLMLFEDTLDGSGARHGKVKQLQQGITCQVIVDRFGPRCPPQLLRRLVTNGEDLLLTGRINSNWGMFGRM
jgi:hypothetical protein